MSAPELRAARFRRRTSPIAWLAAALLGMACLLFGVPGHASAAAPPSTTAHAAHDMAQTMDAARRALHQVWCPGDGQSQQPDGCIAYHHGAPHAPRPGDNPVPVPPPAAAVHDGPVPPRAVAAVLPSSLGPRGPDLHRLQVMRV